MADSWEIGHGLDPTDGDDHATTMPSGYTAIDEYVNGLADELAGVTSTEPSASVAPGASDGPEAAGDPESSVATETFAVLADGETAATAEAVASGNGTSERGPEPAGDDGNSDLLGGLALALSVVAVVLSGVSLYVVRQRSRPPPGR